jgi:septal ring factor EnvC (AmiA/AmiB activator)
MENIITLQELFAVISIALAISGIVSKLSMQVIEGKISGNRKIMEEKIKTFELKLNETDKYCIELDRRIDAIEAHHVETQVSLAKISKDIEYIKSENMKMALNIQKILDNRCN